MISSFPSTIILAISKQILFYLRVSKNWIGKCWIAPLFSITGIWIMIRKIAYLDQLRPNNLQTESGPEEFFHQSGFNEFIFRGSWLVNFQHMLYSDWWILTVPNWTLLIMSYCRRVASIASSVPHFALDAMRSKVQFMYLNTYKIPMAAKSILI